MTSPQESNPWTSATSPPTLPQSISDSNSNDAETIRQVEHDDDDDEDEFAYPGDYSSHMDELFDGEEQDESDTHDSGSAESSGEEDFVYSGVDAGEPAPYMDQLREVLGQDHDEEPGIEVLDAEDTLNESILTDDTNQSLEMTTEQFASHSPSASLAGLMTPESGVSSIDSHSPYFRSSRPFLHPAVSRLRSYTPQASRLASSDSLLTGSQSHFLDTASPPPPSLFSSLSRISSSSNLQAPQAPSQESLSQKPKPGPDVFKWTDLQTISHTVFSRASQKASNVLGASLLGQPTVMATNGFICIGTTEGKVVLYDFMQSPITVCESNVPVHILGPVTALALSHDHTFVASGHATGYIQLYNLKQPHSPVRSVAPTTLTAVASGRKEGHLVGSRIVSIGFIAGRHTALVSADDHGLAFFHSLGKVLFVEASDILRILGRYPDPPLAGPPSKAQKAGSSPSPDEALRRGRYTVLAMAPLPLGTSQHPTDSYNVIAMLTPTKLVVVGLKPTPRTWFKCPRQVDEGGSWKSKSKWIGCLAWFPSVFKNSSPSPKTGSAAQESNGSPITSDQTVPILAYSWGNSLHFLSVAEKRFKQTVKNEKTGKSTEVDVGTISYEAVGSWSAEDDILAMQWLNHKQLVIVMQNSLAVYDLSSKTLVEKVDFDGPSLMAPSFKSSGSDSSGLSSVDSIAHSLRIYKGKLFLLKRDRVTVGTLLTWADKILSLVETGEFLSAIELTRSYYLDEAPGNRNNLPDDPVKRKGVIGDKLRNLMEASTQYAFSEERMSDNTHVTPDNRGVDRTSLFEGLVNTCCRACIALDDFEFLYEDLFQRYDDSGITSIYLRQLEPFILGTDIRYVPPRITQRLVALHESDDRPDYIERIIWHLDPDCLDLNQAIHLCQRHRLYDALIYIYTQALRDFVAPIVELLGLIRQVKKSKKSHIQGTAMQEDLEATVLNAYKIYPYLANALSGLVYPSEEPLSREDAFQAKKDVYTFLFFGRSNVWPPGEGGKLVLTSEEEGGVEPTYPYVRQLLSFDAESFLHSLDIAFEDSYLDEEDQSINRLMIVTIILEVVASGNLSQEDVTMVNIFVARNVPKYSQSLTMSPSALHNILIGLAEDPDTETLEDRQLAAEYLLSVYNPHDSQRIIALFEHAGFFTILRRWHYNERRWDKLMTTYFDDTTVSSLELMSKVGEVLSASSRYNKGKIPDDVSKIVSDNIPRLLHADVVGTAHLVNRLVPDLHSKALEAFGENSAADEGRYEYLRVLLTQLPPDEVQDDAFSPSVNVSRLPANSQHQFLSLQCRFHPALVIPTLQTLPQDSLDSAAILEICETNRVCNAAVWATNQQGDPQGALTKADRFQRQIVSRLLDELGPALADDVNNALQSLRDIADVSREICLQRSQGPGSSSSDVPLEDMWFELLSGQILSIQAVSSSPKTASEGASASSTSKDGILSSLRALVQATFGSLVTVTSANTISFPRLFKRLVNSTPSSTVSHYNELRVILTGMLESYRSDEDLLHMLKHLVERDLYGAIAEVTKERAIGWTTKTSICQYCRKSLIISKSSPAVEASSIVVSRTGSIYHEHCKSTQSVSVH